MQKLILLICFLMSATVAFSQEPAKAPAAAQDNPLSAFNKLAYGHMKGLLLRSAEKVPEQHYNFKPTEAVRSFGQIVGHVADAQYMFCPAVRGEKNPGLRIEQTKTSKADLIAALKDAFAYCDKAYDSMTDASGTQTLKLGPTEIPKMSALMTNIAHISLHYGNLVTYMRLKNIVPPSSE
jgi:uncharacterized damage-inducible protein DinB